MICTQCKTENSASAKFCSSCGAVLEQPVRAQPEITALPHSGAKIFSDSEVQALIDINRKTVQSGGKQSSVSQDDIDKLFG